MSGLQSHEFKEKFVLIESQQQMEVRKMQKMVRTKKSTSNFSSIKESSLDTKLLEIMFLYNDDENSVRAVESTTIDFNEIIEHLGQGNALFIAPKSFGKNQSSKQPITIGNDLIDHI